MHDETPCGCFGSFRRSYQSLSNDVTFETRPLCNMSLCYDFQQCGILTIVGSDESVQPPFKLRNSKCCSVSSLTLIEYLSD